MKWSTRAAGFTLIELLIVIAIIGILSGLLLGGLVVAKDIVWEVRCASNLRQIGMALGMYAQLNGEFYPIEPTEQNPHLGLIAALGKYDPDITRALYCPQAAYMESFARNSSSYSPTGPEAVDSVIDTPENRLAGNISYIYWSFMQNKPCGSGYWRNPDFFPRMLSVRTVMSRVPETRPGQAAYFKKSPPTEVWVMSDFYRQGAPFPHGRFHAGGVNILFLDGHVQNVSGQPKKNYR